MPYRLNAKTLFLTYPQCRATKEEMLDALYNFFGSDHIVEYVVAAELHANGDPHIHVYLKLDVALDTTRPDYLDMLGYHGNYQGCRSPKNVLAYCTKKEDYLANIDVESKLPNKGGKRRAAMKAIIEEEKELEDIIPEYPELLFGYKRLKEDVACWRRDTEAKKSPLPTFLPNPWGWVLFGQRANKRRHYWIFSRQPSKGKTTLFAEPLVKEYRCYYKAGDYTYWSIQGDEQCVILDEYNTPALKWSSLNSMADGGFEYRIFQAGLRKLNKPLIIVLSNQSIADLYPFMNSTLYARFIEKEIL